MNRPYLLALLFTSGCLETNVPEEYLAEQPGGGPSLGNALPKFEDEWQDITTNLTGAISTCRDLRMVVVSPHGNRIIAGLSQTGASGQLWELRGSELDWVMLGQGKNSEDFDARPMNIIFDPEDEDVFWMTGIYGEYGVYRSDDGGDSLQHLGDIRHNDLIAFDFDDPERKTVFSGGHETSRAAWLSNDQGETWEAIGERLPEGSGDSNQPVVLGKNTYLMGTQSYAGYGAIFRTTDAGLSWVQVWDTEVKDGPALDSKGNIYWATNFYDPGIRSEDNGRSWTQLGPLKHGTFVGKTPIILPGDKLAAITTKGIVLSSDRGENWKLISPPPPYTPLSFIYSTAREEFLIKPNCLLSNSTGVVSTYGWKSDSQN